MPAAHRSRRAAGNGGASGLPASEQLPLARYLPVQWRFPAYDISSCCLSGAAKQPFKRRFRSMPTWPAHFRGRHRIKCMERRPEPRSNRCFALYCQHNGDIRKLAMTEIADTFDSAFTKAVDLGNRLADKDKDADLWDIADGLL